MKHDTTTNVYYLVDYHKYWLIRGVYANPKRDKHTLLILDTKKSTERNFETATKYFARLLSRSMAKLADKEFYLALAPSSTADRTSPGLLKIHEILQEQFPDLHPEVLLKRVESVRKATDGGERNKDLHKQTIEVGPGSYNTEARVVILDDVTTSGATLQACRELLIEAGFTDVDMIAIGKSVD